MGRRKNFRRHCRLRRADNVGELQPIDPAWRCHGMDNRTPIDEEAAEPDHRAKGKAKKKTKPSESSKEEDVLIAESDKGPLGA
jgi:hypothetical protein